MIKSAPDVFQFQNFREFLKALYQGLKAVDADYSYRQLSKDLGFQPTNHLYLVIRGERNLSDMAVEKIKKHIQWNAKEKKYFELLVRQDQSKEDADLKKVGDDIKRLSQKSRVTLDDQKLSYFSHWYIPVIKEMIALKGFVPNLTWISKHLEPSVPEDQVKQALLTLERLEIIKRVSGKWELVLDHVTTDVEVNSADLFRYHEELLQLSRDSIALPSKDRDISALTMSLSARQVGWLKHKVIAFRDQIQQELQEMEEPPSVVTQMNIQLFPVTKGK